MSAPVLTMHARQRCEEMAVSRERVERVLADPSLTYASGGRRIAWSAKDPEIAVVFAEESSTVIVVTVVPRTYEQYRRAA